eukprot:gene15821-18801_t
MSKRTLDHNDHEITDNNVVVDTNQIEKKIKRDSITDDEEVDVEVGCIESSGGIPQLDAIVIKSSSEAERPEKDMEMQEVAKTLILSYISEKQSEGMDPVAFTKELGFKLELDEDEDDIWGLIASYLTRPKISMHLFLNYMKYQSFTKPYRRKLDTVNSFEDVVELIKTSKNILIVTGAGVSVSCGIPDFRSKGGVYETIEEKYNLPEPEALFDIDYLRRDPRPFFEFAKEIYPGTHTPSPTHHFIKKLDDKGKLLRNYTQNIDTLEHVVGITPSKLVNCHGSFKSATCITCRRTVPGSELRDIIMRQEIPYCPDCNNNVSFMKPDIVFFGESLPDIFDECVAADRHKVDLLIVMGSSLKVQPVALLPEIMDPNIPQILVNREIVGQPHQFDYVYQGDCDHFVKDIENKVGWS